MSPIAHYYEIAEGVSAFSTTRHGGASKGNYGEFNINPYCGDESNAISSNRLLLASELNVDEKSIILPHQVHAIESRMIVNSFLDLSHDVQSMLLEDVDCLMTNCKNICIGVSTADCIPVLLYDPVQNAVAAIHAGWRGTMNRIVRKIITEMRSCYKTRPQELKAIVGPGISLKNFEVGQEVYDAFEQAGHDMEPIAHFYDKWHIDLPLCNKLELEQCGVSSDNILMSDICTCDQVGDYFSARRLGVDSGRVYTGIILR